MSQDKFNKCSWKSKLASKTLEAQHLSGDPQQCSAWSFQFHVEGGSVWLQKLESSQETAAVIWLGSFLWETQLQRVVWTNWPLTKKLYPPALSAAGLLLGLQWECSCRQVQYVSTQGWAGSKSWMFVVPEPSWWSLVSLDYTHGVLCYWESVLQEGT